MIAIWMRLGTILIVIAIHLVLFLVFATKQRRERSDDKGLALIIVPLRSDPKLNLVKPELTAPIERAPNRTLPIPTIPSLTPSQAASSAPRVDWQASATLAAKDAVAKKVQEEGYRNFGPRKLPSVEPDVPSMFVNPKHQGGDIDDDQLNGVTRIYHSEHCFTQLDFPTLPNLPQSGDGPMSSKANLPRCMYSIGKPEPRGDMFDHLKKTRPLPELKPGTEPGELPERIEPPKSPE
jgi:hypothetical protein